MSDCLNINLPKKYVFLLVNFSEKIKMTCKREVLDFISFIDIGSCM